jgi:hypothetical protein
MKNSRVEGIGSREWVTKADPYGMTNTTLREDEIEDD